MTTEYKPTEIEELLLKAISSSPRPSMYYFEEDLLTAYREWYYGVRIKALQELSRIIEKQDMTEKEKL